MKILNIFSFCVVTAIFAGNFSVIQQADGALDIMKNKAIEQSVQTPVELFWKDMWDMAFHRQGNKFWKKIGFKMGRLGKYKICRAVTIVIMWEFRRHLFSKNENYNVRAWEKIEEEFEKSLREWWDENPLDPLTSLDVGIWKCLVKLYSSWLEPSLRGSRKLKTVQDVILDPSLTVIKKWTDKEHVEIMRSGGGRQAKYNALSSLANKRQQKDEEKSDDNSRSTTTSTS